jgi:hypothetical protein
MPRAEKCEKRFKCLFNFRRVQELIINEFLLLPYGWYNKRNSTDDRQASILREGSIMVHAHVLTIIAHIVDLKFVH